MVGHRGFRIKDPIEGDCETEVLKLIDECEQSGTPLGPAFFFLDQFGYSSFSMGLIHRILKHEITETFSYLNWNLLHPFMTDPTKHLGISKAFGGDEWQEILGLSGPEKENRFRDIYLAVLRNRGGARYAYPFAMRDSNHRVIYWLFFCTNKLRGLEEMKRAMWSVDRSGGYEFSDKFAAERSSLFQYTDDELSRDLVKLLCGCTLTVTELKEYALVQTPACNCLDAFGQMERKQQLRVIDPPSGRRIGSFSKYGDMKVRIDQPMATSLFEMA